MKKIIALLLVIAVAAIPVLTFAADSEQEIIFVAINSDFLELNEKEMPIRRGGQVYVPYSVFTKNFDIHASYNEKERVLVLFNWDYTLTFDISTGKTYNEQGTSISNPAVEHNGTVYVCAEDAAAGMGIYSSVIVDPIGTIIRISKSKPALSDVTFLRLGRDVMLDMISKYNKQQSKQNETSEQKSENKSGQNESANTAVQKGTLYITVSGGPNEAAEQILDALDEYGCKATFFLTASQMKECAASVRRMAAEGHGIGISGYTGDEQSFFESPQSTVKELSLANELLDGLIKTKTRLVRLPSEKGSRTASSEILNAVKSGGYRLWDWNISIKKASSAAAMAKSAQNMLEKRTAQRTVLQLACSKMTADALPKILKYAKDNGYTVSRIDDWSQPVNFKGIK